jgi:hypothetical protein
MHRIGGLEKADGTGQHQLRPRRTTSTWSGSARREDRAHPLDPRARTRRRDGDDGAPGRLGLDLGAIDGAVQRPSSRARRWPATSCVTSTRCRTNLGEIFDASTGVIPELNMGQLVHLIRAEYLVDAHYEPSARCRACRSSHTEIEAAIDEARVDEPNGAAS